MSSLHSDSILKLIAQWLAGGDGYELYSNLRSLKHLLGNIGYEARPPRLEDLRQHSSYMLCMNCGGFELVDMLNCVYEIKACSTCLHRGSMNYGSRVANSIDLLLQVEYIRQLLYPNANYLVLRNMLSYYIILNLVQAKQPKRLTQSKHCDNITNETGGVIKWT